MEQHEDLWHVQLESGEVRILTLDQLDAFYQNGIIDEQTYVLEDGSMDWRTLGEVLGVSEPEAAPPPSVVVYEPFLSMRPVVSEIDAAELDDIPFKKTSRGKYFVAAGAIGAVVAVVAVMAASRIGSHASPASVSAAVVNVVPEQPAIVIPPPPPVVQTPALNADVKKQQKQNRAKTTPPAHKTSPPPFGKGGNAHDPLNAKI